MPKKRLFAAAILSLITFTAIVVVLLTSPPVDSYVDEEREYVPLEVPTVYDPPAYISTAAEPPPPIPVEEPDPITHVALPAMLNFMINERPMEVHAYNINGYKYFRLCNIAYALATTPMTFGVAWRDALSAVLLPGEQIYSADHADIEVDLHEQLAAEAAVSLLLNGTAASLTAHSINGYKYFQLQDIAELLGFRINWVGGRETFIIDTGKNYIPTEPIFTSEPLPDNIIELITDRSFPERTPFPHSDLVYLTITHVDFYGNDRIGNLIVAAEIGDEVLDIFREIHEYSFPIYRMRLIDFYDTSDYLSMADNNSVAFNFRYIAGTTRISRHGFGMAIDINPIQNPYIRGDTIWPLAGSEYLDRTYIRPGMIVEGDAVYRAFTSRGWIWGGHWTSPIDFHHFERRG